LFDFILKYVILNIIKIPHKGYVSFSTIPTSP